MDKFNDLSPLISLILEQVRGMKYPPSMTALTFTTGNPVPTFENGKYTGYRVNGGDLKSDEHLFETCYRCKKCAHCGAVASATEFHWKVRGMEGPFPKLWGKRDTWCKQCRLTAKRISYKRRKKLPRAFKLPREGSKILDVTELEWIESIVEQRHDERHSAFQELIEQIFFGMAHERQTN